jgi:hypothetical protein
MYEIGADDEDVRVSSHLFGHALREPSRVRKFIGHLPDRSPSLPVEPLREAR